MSAATVGDRLWADFNAICDCGGRQSGTPSEAAAVALLSRLGAEATGVLARRFATPYGGWRALDVALETAGGRALPAVALLRSAATPEAGLNLEVVDLGRGTPEEFEAHREEIPGRAVMVRHELMFAAGTLHRRLKYEAAVRAGAAAFLIAGPAEGSLVSGSSGRGVEVGVPAVGIAPEGAAALTRTASGFARIMLRVVVEESQGTADSLLFDLPGRSDEWVVLSAHIDGHALGESAMDNASGLAAALATARALAPAVAAGRRGLRLALFNIEEWALNGSASYVAGLSRPERDAISLNVNLDTVAGGRKLTALTSGYADLEPFLLACSSQTKIPLGVFRPLQRNSDHANFAEAGIPAFRLVSGFGETDASTRLVLTRYDTRDTVRRDQLESAATLATAITGGALRASPEQAACWRRRSRAE